MPKVLIRNDQKLLRLPIRALARLSEDVLRALGVCEKEASVLFTDDDAIQLLNRQYLNRDRPTNVLSFSYQEAADPDAPPYDNPALGDVVVSVETCLRNAEAARIRALEEIVFCLIHGLCHLAGHDHVGVARSRAQKMRRLEQKLMREFGATILKVDRTRG